MSQSKLETAFEAGAIKFNVSESDYLVLKCHMVITASKISTTDSQQRNPEHRIMITIKILVFSAIDLEGKFENQDFNHFFFMQNLDMILIEILIGNIDLKLIENIDLLLIGS